MRASYVCLIGCEGTEVAKSVLVVAGLPLGLAAQWWQLLSSRLFEATAALLHVQKE